MAMSINSLGNPQSEPIATTERSDIRYGQSAKHGCMNAQLSADPASSKKLMMATYVLGGACLAASIYYLGSDNSVDSANWAAATVAVSGVISWVRHSVFHRSDAARMGWDLGRRNDFQIEVGLANLAWGLVCVAALALGWSSETKGAVVLVFGLYMAFAALLHIMNLRNNASEGGGRFVPVAATTVFAGLLLWVGLAAVNA